MTDSSASSEPSPSGAPTESAARAARYRQQWFIVERWQEYTGEARANLMRIAAIGCFYFVELLNYYGFALGPLNFPPSAEKEFHIIVTSLAIAWTMVSLATLLCLRLRYFPAALTYVTTACDLILLTMTLMVADGQHSPLVAAYFLIIAASALRFRLALVWFATGGSASGYLLLASCAKWRGGDGQAEVPEYQQMIVLVALALAGCIIGQIVRRVRMMAEDFAALVG